MRTLSLEAGMTTDFARRRVALRMRVRRTATGSVIIGVAPRLPGGLAHAGDLAEQRLLPQADAADAELAVHGARTAAQRAAPDDARSELRRLPGLDDETLLCHGAGLVLSVGLEGDPQLLQQ